MPFTDVINTTGAKFKQYPEMTVYLGATDGSAPDAAAPEVFEDVYCVQVVQSAGGNRLDFAELEYSLDAHLQNRTQPAAFARMVEVRLPDMLDTRIHLGDYVDESVRVDQGGETLKATSQLRPYHFGKCVTGYDVWDPMDSDEKQIWDHIVFNPTVDNKTIGNMSDKARTGHNGYLWTHPEIADSDIGETYQEQYRSEWALSSAVQSIVELLNPDEDFIDNPDPSEYLTVIAVAPPIRHVVIPIGTRLNDALDMLLLPLGFNHYVDYVQNDPDGSGSGLHDDTKPIIRLFKIGDGDEKELKFQAAGSVLNLESSNVNQFAVSNAIGDSFNEVEVLGEFQEAELTIPLYAAWPAEKDSLDKYELAKDGSQYDGNENVWRLFIANEAGDIDPAVTRYGSTPSVPDFGTVFDIATPHRRTLGEPLTYAQTEEGASGSGSPPERQQRRPVKVEYSVDGGVTWKPEDPGWTIKLCPDQIGIYFDGVSVPEELCDAGDSFRLRVTGTLFGDSRIRGLAVKQSYSANGRANRKVLFMPDKFQHRWRETEGTYRSVLIDTGNDADERFDGTEIDDYAEKIRDQNHYADIACEFRLPGWHTEYKIGDLLTKIAGREISLDAAPVGAPSSRYVQIVERRFEMSATGGPSTVLIVDRGISQT